MSELALKRLFLEYVDVIVRSQLSYQDTLREVIEMANKCLSADEELCSNG